MTLSLGLGLGLALNTGGAYSVERFISDMTEPMCSIPRRGLMKT
jgi:hypothetical protein